MQELEERSKKIEDKIKRLMEKIDALEQKLEISEVMKENYIDFLIMSRAIPTFIRSSFLLSGKVGKKMEHILDPLLMFKMASSIFLLEIKF